MLHQFLSGDAGPINNAITIETDEVAIEEVRVHLSSAAASSGDTITATLNSAEGEKHDAVIMSKDLNGLTDYVYQPTHAQAVRKADTLTFAWANTNNVRWGIEVVMRPM